jgi:cytochrome c553
MTAIAANMSKEDMLSLAAYFAEQKPVTVRFTPDAARAARGKDRADSTLCTMCHQGHYQGQNEIPRVAGQHLLYLKKQLTALQEPDAHERCRVDDQRFRDAQRRGHRPVPGGPVPIASGVRSRVLSCSQLTEAPSEQAPRGC